MEYQLTQTGEQVQNILDQAPTTEQNLQSEITRSTEKDQELETAIGNEKTRAEGVEGPLVTAVGNLETDVEAIKGVIPVQATPSNKLVDKNYVDDAIATNTADFKGTYPSLEALITAVPEANANDYAFVVTTDQDGNVTYSRYKYVDGTGWTFEYALNNSSFTAAQWAAIQSGITALLVAKLAGLPNADALVTQMNALIAVEKNRAEAAEGTLTNGLNAEILARQNADTALQQNINAEAILRDNGDDALQDEIDGINAKIPTQASASNQLADKAFVNSSIATNTAEFKGTYNSLEDLEHTVTTANANDYAYVISTDAVGNTLYNRYKYVEGIGWVFEYALNNSSFTATQWAAIQSGITAALVAKLNNLPTNDALNAMFATITSLIPSTATSDNKLVDFAQMMTAIVENNADVYIPDNVDIDAKAGNMLQFKDNIYNPLLPTGMGRVHLRRNASLDTEWYGFDGIVEDVYALDSMVGTPDAIFWDRINEIFVGKKGGVYYKAWTADDNYSPTRTDCHYICNDIPYIWNGSEFIVDDQAMPSMRNILTQSMLPYTNTIYIIKDDFDLNGATITIPANCVLDFQGGSLSNGTLVGNNTVIVNNSNKPILDVTVSGEQKFINDLMPVDWFKGNSDSDKIQAAVDFCKVNHNGIKFLNRTYTLTKTVVVDVEALTMMGASNGGEYGSTGTVITAGESFTSDYTGNPFFYFCGTGNAAGTVLGNMSFRIEGIQFLNAPDNDCLQMRFAGSPARPFYINYCTFLNIRKAIYVVDNGTSTNVGFMHIEHNTFVGVSWALFVAGFHAIMGCTFTKNVAEQSQGCINIGYSDTHSTTSAESPVPDFVSYALSNNILIADNLLEGTVDSIFIAGGVTFVNILRNYFERGNSNYRQFINLESSSSGGSLRILDNLDSNGVVHVYLPTQAPSICLIGIPLSRIHYRSDLGVSQLQYVGRERVRKFEVGEAKTFYGIDFQNSLKPDHFVPLGPSGESNYSIFDGKRRYRNVANSSSVTNYLYYTRNIDAGKVLIVTSNVLFMGEGSFLLKARVRVRNSSPAAWSDFINIGSVSASKASSVKFVGKYKIPYDADILDIQANFTNSGNVYVEMPTVLLDNLDTFENLIEVPFLPAGSDYATDAAKLPTTAPEGSCLLLKSIGKNVYYRNGRWEEEDGASVGILRSGTLADKPLSSAAYSGFKYFCIGLHKDIVLEKYVEKEMIYNQSILGNASLFGDNPGGTSFYKFVVEHTTSRVDGGTRGKVLFVKSQSSDEDSIEVEFINVSQHYKYSIMQCPDSTIYPYIKYYNNNSGVRTFRTFELEDIWYEDDGAVAGVARSGVTANRPVGSSIYVGFMYMDTEVGKPIYASAISGDTVTWVDATGATV